MTTPPGPAAAQTSGAAEPRLIPHLSTWDAASAGLAAILGAGIFAAIAPAVGITGGSVVVALMLAGGVAGLNATSAAQLAAAYPRAGGTYEFGNRVLGPWWGFASGWMFITANTAGVAAIAQAFSGYLHALLPALPVALGAIVALGAVTTINALGIKRSVGITNVIVVLEVLALVMVIALGARGVRVANLRPFAPGGVGGVLRAAGLLFFAYTGYARIATLVEEVRDPVRSIPRAILSALSTAILLYVGVSLVVVGILGPSATARSASPLAAAMLATGSGLGLVIVTAGALITTFNEDLSDSLGVSRVVFAMARGGDLPAPLMRLTARANPVTAVILTGVVAAGLAVVVPFGTQVAVSSFATLLYYALTNYAGLRLAPERRRYPRALALGGLLCCLALAFSLAPVDWAAGLGVLAVGLLYRVARTELWPRVRRRA
jgi:APA family basic amino acid/polyamine antiporter